MGELHEWIFLNTEGSTCVVEFGAGMFEKLHWVHPSVPKTVGIEVYEPYFNLRNVPANCTAILGNMQDFGRLVKPEDMDTALFVDSLEHLSDEDAYQLISKVKWQFRKILVFVPEGNHPQTTDAFKMGGDTWQTHRSTWHREDLIDMGFQKVVVDPVYHNEPNKDRGAIFGVWETPK